jgi:hypothetical protein
LKKFAIILTCALLIGTISGCTTSDTSSTSTEASTTISEKNYPIHFFPVPDGFEAYYHDKKLDVPLSETESIEKTLSIEIERNQNDIKLKADLPILNNTEIDWHENINANIEKEALTQLYIEKVEQFFEAGANKDFSKISNYSDNFFNETQDEITNSTFMAEDMYNMTLKKIKAYDHPLNLTLNKGILSFVLAGYVDYEYTADYLDAPLQHDTNDINFRFVYDSKKQTWLVDQLSTINTSFQELPKPENEADLVIKTF